MEAEELLAWLAALPAEERDAAIEARLGIADPPSPASAPEEHLVGYHASGVAAILHMLLEVPVDRDDVLVDLGSGLGKVALLARLFTGARVRGIELDPSLVERARHAAARHGIDVELTCGDAREASVPIDDGTVFFLYLPFTGPVLDDVMERLRRVAVIRPIVVCALGVDLDRTAPWLVRRPLDAFWLAIYDSAPPEHRRSRASVLDVRAEAIARAT